MNTMIKYLISISRINSEVIYESIWRSVEPKKISRSLEKIRKKTRKNVCFKSTGSLAVGFDCSLFYLFLSLERLKLEVVLRLGLNQEYWAHAFAHFAVVFLFSPCH